MASGLITFIYKARTRDGKFVQGKIRAESANAVTDDFVKRGIVILEIREEGVLERDFKLRKPRVKTKEVAQFMRQVATMTGAAITLSRTLDVLRDQTTNPAMRDVLSRVRQDIDTGSTLANALAKHSEVFTPLTIAMVRAGEMGGFLTPDVLLSIAEGLETEARLRGKIRAAVTYPAIVMIISLLMIMAILIFVVPTFVNIFASFGAPLPLPTQILVWLSDWIKITALPGLLLIPVIITLWRNNKNKLGFRQVVDPIKLKMPVFGKLQKKIISARFARNFGSLLAAGLPIMQVMEVVGATSGNVLVEEALEDVKKYVAVGELISPQLRRHPVFPKLLVEMMAVGEEAGELPHMMEKIAISYDEEVESMADSLTSLLEPLLLVTLGIIVGGMVIALYLPIFGMYGLIGKS